MYAVIEHWWRQYKVAPGDIVTLDKIEKEVDEIIEIKKVLLTFDDDQNVEIGEPFVSKTVKVQIVESGKAKKIRVIKFKAKKRYFRNKGHRQLYTKVKVLEIV